MRRPVRYRANCTLFRRYFQREYEQALRDMRQELFGAPPDERLN
jgi:hypothetical protein